MTREILIVLSILVGAVVLFISNRVRIDLIGLLVLGSLAVSGVITPSDSLAGFSNPAVITVWAVLRAERNQAAADHHAYQWFPFKFHEQHWGGVIVPASRFEYCPPD